MGTAQYESTRFQAVEGRSKAIETTSGEFTTVFLCIPHHKTRSRFSRPSPLLCHLNLPSGAEPLLSRPLMQRLRSLRRSISRSSRRKSGGSASSAGSSPRPSQDTGSLRSLPASDTASIPDLAEHAAEPQAVDPPAAPVASNALSQPHASPSSFDSSASDPPVIVDPPSPSPPVAASTASTATGREALVDSSLHRRKASPLPNKAPVTEHVDAKVEDATDPTTETMPVQRPWLILAVASGGFAALNGVFAKLYVSQAHRHSHFPSTSSDFSHHPDSTHAPLSIDAPNARCTQLIRLPSTTASLTTTLATFLSTHLSLPAEYVNPVIRTAFFLLNLLSNAIMWALFTRALTAHPSATKVSLINTSANFLVTAVLGTLIFTESLPPGWFGGAALLVLGTLIIGRDRGGEPIAIAGDEEEGESGAATPRVGMGFEKDEDGDEVTELAPLLAGDETDGARADGE